MIYLIGGAPRCGKSTLSQSFASQVGIGWISTDVIVDVIQQARNTQPDHWDAHPEVIAARAQRFLPYLERMLWGLNSMADGYVIEGVHFLPNHVVALAERFEVRAVFLGRSSMTLEHVDGRPGKSPGYAALPETTRAQIAEDVPAWSGWIRGLAEVSGVPYVDVASGPFESLLEEAADVLRRQ